VVIHDDAVSIVKTLVGTALLVGVITTYAGKYVNQPLYCDNGTGMIYASDLPFIALPVTEFESGRARCGDQVRVTINGQAFYAQALDAGPLENYRVEQFGDLPIVADIPAHLWQFAPDISGVGSVFNESAFNRACTDCKMGHMRQEEA
jgi:hypothetical protein